MNCFDPPTYGTKQIVVYALLFWLIFIVVRLLNLFIYAIHFIQLIENIMGRRKVPPLLQASLSVKNRPGQGRKKRTTFVKDRHLIRLMQKENGRKNQSTISIELKNQSVLEQFDVGFLILAIKTILQNGNRIASHIIDHSFVV